MIGLWNAHLEAGMAEDIAEGAHMPEYDIHVRCIYCDKEHPLLIKVFLANGPNRKQSISEWFTGRDVPPQVSAIRNHGALCLKTGKKFVLDRDDNVLLVPLWP
jgi:hypothetical protein